MQNLDKILEMADNEFGAMVKNGKFRSREEIDSVYKLMDIVKDVYCVWDYEDGMDAGDSYGEGNYGYDGGSYGRRGRGSNAKRDSMGRYRDGGYRNGNYRDGYGRRGYRDGGKEEFTDELRDMLRDAPDEQTRQSIQRVIDNIQ